MEYRVLGPLEVLDRGEPLSLAGSKQRSLLALLLMYANRVLPRDRVVDGLWGDHPPDTAVQSLHVHVSRLRKLLPTGALKTRPPGYLLEIEVDELDVHRFERMLEDGRRALADGDSGRAARVLRDALLLWRGPALVDFASEPFAQAEIARLEDLRVSAVEARVDADLALGREADLAGELGVLVAEYPHRERLRGQLMLALYRSGRQAEALEAYRQARDVLTGELGIDPSAALQRLEKQILTQDAELDRPPAPSDVRQRPSAPMTNASAPEARKTVTVLFADLVDSTRLGRQLDPEVLRRLVARYFDETRSVIERHGGIVEKFIGDAVLAVFGVPTLHEDDALRAVRAAGEMRESLAALNRDLEQGWGVRLQSRVGINSGEVVAGDHAQGHVFVTGEVVNFAKRLEEAAAADEILIGEATYRLVRDAVIADRVFDRVVKGGGTIEALQLVTVLPLVPGHARRFDSPLVDREQQLSALRSVFAGVEANRSCHLLTLLGSAGIGKSRLVREFLVDIDAAATVVSGRCLPYGDGITYWPLIEVVRDIVRREGQAGQSSSAVIADLLRGEERARQIVELITDAMGLGGGGAADGEASWAVRKLFETLADRRPLVVVLDDLQWAEPTFVALVDSVAELSRDSPILLLCIARPELLDGHPGWGGGKLNATTMLLEPLNDADCRTLISNTLGRGPLPVQVETRIAEMAGGNPLFAEELVAMLLEEELLAFENNGWVAADDLLELPVPQSINTLLAARLEGLPDDERSLLVRASVAGTLFHLGAIAELAPELPAASLERTLAALIRRDLIRPGRSSFAGDDAYRFRHLLIRDAAYRSLPKATRADLHERFAAWLERAAAGRSGEYEEIVGYHYEQAFQFRAELAPVDEEGRVLALAAGSRLAAAGRRAFARGDMPAATALLERATSVSVGDAARRAELLPELGAALTESGRLAEAESALREAQQEASVLGDERLEAHVLILQLSLRLQVATDATAAAAAAVERVLPVFRRAGDQLGICRAHRLDAWVHWIHCQTHAAEAAWEKAAEHAHRAGAVREEADSLLWLASSALFGPCPAREGVARCHEVLSKMPGGVIAQTLLLFPLAALRAMLGELDEAQRMLAEANATLADVGVTLSANSHPEAFVAMLADDPAAAERCLRADYDSLADMGEKGFLSTTAALLARAVEAQRRDEEAYELTEVAERNGASDDLATQIVWRGVRARILAERGSAEEAEQLARDAVALAEQTDRLNYHGDALDDLASVLERSGRTEEELRALEAALAVFERKENLVASARIRVRLGEGKPA